MPENSPWMIRHYTHDDVALGEAFPQGLQFGIPLGRVGTVAYSLDFEQSLANREFTNPYVTDFKLYKGDVPLMGGMHTSFEISEAESNTLSVGGKDWMHWFELDEYPFDSADPLFYRYQVVGRDIALIVKDILDTTLALPNSLDFTYTIAAIGQTTNFKIEPADTEKLLSKFDGLAKLDPGFDIEITHDREFIIHAPQRGETLTGFALRQGDNIENLRYAESGPTATKLRGFAQAATRLGYVYDDPAQAAYRRIVQSVEFSDVVDAAQLQGKTIAEGQRQAAPHIEFSCSYVGDDSFWSDVSVGDSIHVVGDLRYDQLDSYFRLVGIECAPTDDGFEEITLSFDDGTLSL